jgi:hypothetical protein
VHQPVLQIRNILVRIRIRGSVSLTNESGSVSDFNMATKNYRNFFIVFLINYFLKLHLHRFSKIKSQKGVTKSRNQGFSYHFCLMIEGSASGAGARSRSLPHTKIRIREVQKHMDCGLSDVEINMQKLQYDIVNKQC